MSKPRFDKPLSTAAEESLRYAAKAARAKALETGGKLVVWRNGKVTTESVLIKHPISRRRPLNLSSKVKGKA